MYRYLFYKLYKFYEGTPFWSAKWWSDWKASFSLLVLEIWSLVSIVVYYEVITKKTLLPEQVLNKVAIGVVVLLAIVKYFAFEHKGRWKRYVAEFSQWPKNKNRIGTLIVWLIVLFILGNLIFSFYLMSQIDWQRYR